MDIEWLRSEVVRWVQGNLMEKWYVCGCEENQEAILIQLLGDRLSEDTLRSVSGSLKCFPSGLELTRSRVKRRGHITKTVRWLRKYLANSCAVSRQDWHQRAFGRVVR